MCFFFFKQKTAYDMSMRDWSADVCSSDLEIERLAQDFADWCKKQGYRDSGNDDQRDKPACHLCTSNAVAGNNPRMVSGMVVGSIAGDPHGRSEERRVG